LQRRRMQGKSSATQEEAARIGFPDGRLPGHDRRRVTAGSLSWAEAPAHEAEGHAARRAARHRPGVATLASTCSS